MLTGDASPAAKAGTRRTLVRVLETVLRLLHPIMPFITEEIWQRVKPLVGKTADSIMLEAYPVADESKINVEAEQDVAWLQAVISAIRNIRGELNISPAKALTVLFHNGGAADQVRLERYRSQLAFLARLEALNWVEAGAELPFAATKLVGDMSLLVPLKGLIDAEAEAARLRKELDKLEKEVGRLAGKLENPAFVDKAPADVVAKEQEKLAAVKAEIGTLKEQLRKVEAL